MRTPFVKAGTVFKDRTALDLGVHSVNALLDSSGIDPNQVQEMAYGIVVTVPNIPQMAREIAFASKLPASVRAITFTDNCITGLSAIEHIADSIRAGRIDVGIAGGVESMSNFAVLYNPKASKVFRNMNQEKTASGRIKQLLKLGFGDFFPWNYGVAEPSTGLSMGEHCELMVKEWKIGREEQDEIAYNSQMNAHKATEDGRLKAEIAPLDGVDHDLLIRESTTKEKLAQLKPVFDRSEAGTITAGNSSPLTDGAAAVLLMSEEKAKELGMEILAYVRDLEFVGIDPKDGLLMGPGITVPRLLKRNNIKLEDIDIVEMHEAFGGQVACNLKAWKDGWKEPAIGTVPTEKLNPLGSSIAVGHPFAATGVRLATTLANELHRRKAKYGIISVCGAGATAGALLLEYK